MNMNIVAITLAFVAAGSIYAATKEAGRKEERARVEIEATKKNDAAKKARSRVTTTNATSVLEGYYRD